MMFREEKDSLGVKRVPSDVYYGIQTQRAIENFPISGLVSHEKFVNSYILLKKSAAISNSEYNGLDLKIKDAIVEASDKILSGKLRDQFVVDVFQMGAGTAFHMNVNEVLANLATEFMGGKKGEYRCHPNDHVNMGQSTNDTFPTAMRICIAMLLQDFLKELKQLSEALEKKSVEFDTILKSGRTHLQDASPIRLGQEFLAYANTIKRCHQILSSSLALLYDLGIGGSAVGTGLNTNVEYRFKVVELLSKWIGLPFTCASDMRETMQSNLAIGQIASGLKMCAVELSRISNDLRLMSSGPLTGFAEIVLPAVQPGSSIMPGKVNPSIVEMLNMVCLQVIGCELTVSMAVQSGQLELNVMMPVMAFNMNFIIDVFKNAIHQFTTRCVSGIEANQEMCKYYAEVSPSIAAALNPYIGYEKASDIFKESIRSGETVMDVVRKNKILTEEQIQDILNPQNLTEPRKKNR